MDSSMVVEVLMRADFVIASSLESRRIFGENVRQRTRI